VLFRSPEWTPEQKSIATLNAAGATLEALRKNCPFLIGGDADLGSSTQTLPKDKQSIGPGRYDRQNIRFGVREHAMGAACSGIVRHGGYLVFIFNKKQGIMTNLKLRQAVLVALDMQPILQATFGNPDLFALDPSLYPKGTPWYTAAGAEWYNVHNVARAKQLAKEAGYAGQPIRWLATQQYDYMFKSSVIASAQLQQAGFRVDLQVMDWASVLDHRGKPVDYDMFVTGGGFVPDPALQNVFGAAYPGWWDTPDKNRLFARFAAGGTPPDTDYKTVQDYLFRYVAAECGRLGIPVAIHVTDPEAFFRPLDPSNERYEELIHHPDWHFYGPKFPSKESILEARNRAFAKHPNTTFISLHVGNWPENLD
jgi:hypothetical protein